MAYRLTRFERFLVGGLLVSGIGLATIHLVEDDVPGEGIGDGDESAPVASGPPRDWFENELPPIDYFVDDWFDGTDVDGDRVEGAVTGYPYGGREIKITDRRTGEDRVLVLARFPSWRIGRRMIDREARTLYEWHIVRPGGSSTVLYGYLVEETDRTFVVDLESGRVPLPKDHIRKVVPVRKRDG